MIAIPTLHMISPPNEAKLGNDSSLCCLCYLRLLGGRFLSIFGLFRGVSAPGQQLMGYEPKSWEDWEHME